MSEVPKKQKTGTLDWPIGVQVALTGGLLIGLIYALHLSQRNDAVPEPEGRIFTANAPAAVVVEPISELTLPETDWQGKRVLTTDAALAEAAKAVGADVHLLAAEVAGDPKLTRLTADQLDQAEPFEVVVVAEDASRPPKHLARKVAADGLLFLLDPAGGWIQYRETAGMLRTDDQR